MSERVEIQIGGKKLILEAGRAARQADGAIWAQYGDSVVLTTVVASKIAKQIDFLPLTVDYQEKAYAAGKIPGSFFRREGRPTERETLICRLIDRPHRPLFPEGWFYETQIVANALSSDQGAAVDLLGIIGASTALFISDIPFSEPIAAVRVGRIDGKIIVNPTVTDLEKSELNIVVAGSANGVMMVECEARELPEEVILEAIDFGHQELRPIIAAQVELQRRVGKPKRSPLTISFDSSLVQAVKGKVLERLKQALAIPNKTARQESLDAILKETQESLNPDGSDDRSRQIMATFHDLERREVRQAILERGIRADGRRPGDIRPISIEIGVLPRTHGSALFTRGETQSLAVVTLGTEEDEQRLDQLEGASTKAFMLHYNFPPFSVGETRPMRGPGRREIGHGVLAERALKPVIPSKEEFPYVLRIVSDILESNGSSSMATVCGGTLALMDAGVPIKTPIAGIAMGLIKEGDKVQILSDILGLEDHLGDMDFKVTGSSRGITALQMDIKIGGITSGLMRSALEQAREGRLFILEKMLAAIAQPRATISTYAPRIMTMKIKVDKIREVIGPGGKMIRSIVEKSGAKVNVDDSGLISIASVDEEACKKAMDMINEIVAEVEVGKIYYGKVKRIMDFGAIVELPGRSDGLCHISQLDEKRVKSVSDVVKEGEEIPVKVMEVGRDGKIRLSRKEALKELGQKDVGEPVR